MSRTFFGQVRSAFLAGVLVLVPLAVTLWVLFAAMGFLESAIHLLPDAWQPENLVGRPIPGLGILLTLTTILALGFATNSFLGRRAITTTEAVVARVPVLSSVYHGVKQLMETLLTSSGQHFRQVVLVEWPRRGVWAVGFRTGEGFVQREGEPPLVNVFLPTTPNPTSGFYMMVPEEEVHVLDLSVEDAFKLIMSAGIVAPPQKRVLTEEIAYADLPEEVRRQLRGDP